MSRHPVATLLRSTIDNKRPLPLWRRPTDANAGLDPLHPAAIADPVPTYRRLHQRGGVHYCPHRNHWVIAGYDAVRLAARSHQVLSSAEGVASIRVGLPMMLTSDRPDHGRLRVIAAPHFTRDAIGRRRELMEQVTHDAIEQIRLLPGADAVAALAVPLPIRVIAAHLGTPTKDFKRFRRWSEAIVAGFSPNSRLDALRLTPRVFYGVTALHAYMRGQIDQRRRAPGDDVLSALVNSSEAGGLSDEELFWFVLMLLVAGNETTTNLIGIILIGLADQPEVLEQLRDDRTLIPGAVEEFIRWGSPVQGLYRTARTEFSVAGATIPSGARVLLLFAAANRDPSRYSEPDRVMLDRNPTDHLAFGHGIHFCLGAHLARLEATVLLEYLADRIARIELAGKPAWTENPNLRGLAHLPLRVVAR